MAENLKSSNNGKVKLNLTIEHINSQSLLCNFNEVKLLIRSRDVDILCVSETWLNANVLDTYIDIPGFKVFRNDGGKGGGTCIYVNDILKVTKVTSRTQPCEGVEDLWLSIQHRMLPSILLGSVYRHPKASVKSFDYLLDIFSEMVLKSKPMFILGDLNSDQLCQTSKLKQILKQIKLQQLINKPTRVTQSTATLLEVIITNKSEMVIESDVYPCEIGDHELISMNIDVSKPKRKPTYRAVRCLGTYSSDTFCNHLLDNIPSLNDMLKTDDVNIQVSIFTDIFNECLNTCASVEATLMSRPSAPWINNEIKEEITKRDAIRKNLKKDRMNLILQNQFKCAKKKVKLMINKAKVGYFHEQINENRKDGAKTWKTIRKLIPDQNKVTKEIDFTNELEKANEFNEFFVNVGKRAFVKTQENINENVNVSGNNAQRSLNHDSFRPQPVQVEDIILIIKDLSNSRACGSDQIELRFVRDALPVLAFYITLITNTSIVTGMFPKLYKHALVVPGFKSGEPEEVGNYRPISILPVISKVIEKVVAKQLMNHLELNNLLSHTQHGFRAGLSTETALLKITDAIYENMNKKISLLTLCDLSKAFDIVSHTLLLDKLTVLDVDSFWFNDYLSERTQSVRIGKTISNALDIVYGVPQGSILGPILFIIFTKDMIQYVDNNCLLIQYADDTQTVHSDYIDNLDGLIRMTEETLCKLKYYFDTNGLLLNTQKTQCIFIGSHHYISKIPVDTAIKFGDSYIVPSTQVKNLGLYIDRHMSFNIHVDEIRKKVMGILFYLNRIKDHFDKKTRTTIVETLALSQVNYCSLVWGSANKTQIHCVQLLQNFAAKVAEGNSRKYDHVTPILKDLNWMNITEKLFYDISIMMYKMMKNEYPEWIYNFRVVGEERRRGTRQECNLIVPNPRTDMGSRSLAVRGTNCWNSLPMHVKESGNINIFKGRLKRYILYEVNDN